jgi:aspartate/methionine/tyrosine aminotransferase
MPDAYFSGLKTTLAARRDFLVSALNGFGFEARPAAGAYFTIAGTAGLDAGGDDVAFCRKMTIEAGVTAVPLSAFFSGRDLRGYVRFCFAKTQPTLERAAARLAAWRAGREP